MAAAEDLRGTGEASRLRTFTCPRCRTDVERALYGPCDDCLGELRHKYAANARPVEVEEYEPKMNVTPNAVALKD